MRYFVKWDYVANGQARIETSTQFTSRKLARRYIKSMINWNIKFRVMSSVRWAILPREGEQYVVEPSEIGALLCAQDN